MRYDIEKGSILEKHNAPPGKQNQGVSPKPRGTCLKCYRPLSHCLCPKIRPFQTRARFVILMHPKEARKIRNGTGRLAHLALKNSEIITGIDFSTNPRVQALLEEKRYIPFVLYPGRTSKDITEFSQEELAGAGRQPLVFVIDGTWKAAKKMMKLSRNLHQLPRIAVHSGTPSRFVIKHQPNEQCLSTAEAVNFLLADLEKKGVEKLENSHLTLMDTLEEMVKIQLSFIKNASDSRRKGERNRRSAPRPKSKKRRKLYPFFR